MSDSWTTEEIDKLFYPSSDLTDLDNMSPPSMNDGLNLGDPQEPCNAAFDDAIGYMGNHGDPQEPCNAAIDDAIGDMGNLGDPQEPCKAAFGDAFGETGNPGEPEDTFEPLFITTNSTSYPEIVSGEYDMGKDHAEAAPAGLTVAELQELIVLMQRQHEYEMGKLKAEHQGEMDDMRRRIETLTASLEHFKKAKAPRTPQATPRTSQAIPRTPQATPPPKRVSKVVSPKMINDPPVQRTPPHKRGLIETMWSPETSPEQRRAMLKGMQAPPLHPTPFFQEKMTSLPNSTSSPAATMNAYELSSPPTYSSDVIFNGTQAYAPAMGSSPPVVDTATTSFQGSLIQSQFNNSPTLGHKNKGRGKARAPAKPRASTTSKRAAATPKVTTKVTKSTHKRKASSPSPAAAKSLQDLYHAQFGTLTHEEKCQLVLPLLQGIDPDTGVQGGASPGRLATNGDFEYIGTNLFDQAPVQDQMMVQPQYWSPYAAPGTQMMNQGDMETDLGPIMAYNNAASSPSPPYGSPSPSQECSSHLLPIARSHDHLAMVQQAVQELGPGAMGGATRQQEALQRTQTRRR